MALDNEIPASILVRLIATPDCPVLLDVRIDDGLSMIPNWSTGRLGASSDRSQIYRDDLEQLEVGMTVNDAYYRWVRDATGEGHDRPAAS